jgi:hypothetical protein
MLAVRRETKAFDTLRTRGQLRRRASGDIAGMYLCFARCAQNERELLRARDPRQIASVDELRERTRNRVRLQRQQIDTAVPSVTLERARRSDIRDPAAIGRQGQLINALEAKVVLDTERV